MLARQINPGKVQEVMRSYEDATSRPHGYLMLDLKPTTDDQQRSKTNILPGEIAKFIQKQSHAMYDAEQCMEEMQCMMQNAMYDAEQRMKEIMHGPHLSAVEKSKLYSDQLNRFLIFNNKMDVPDHYQEAPVQGTPPETSESVEIPPQVPPTPVFAEITPPVSATPKPNFLTPPPTEEEDDQNSSATFSTIG